ncbi:hypothetical protein INT45_014150 [Circinella minor]|uniref:Uncharacterized protein n=1 Tax=Circinella minor TaxID=1195481 RepID=A0A8H7RU54_9FUNG|nr:hypothetical protein INT45_014150 [Circinella minor]
MNNNNALDQSLDLLTQRLLHARAQQRRMKRNAERKREILLNSGNVLEYELKDAFSIETMSQKKKKKKIRISPPPGLFPLLINNIPSLNNLHYPDDNKILAPTATTFMHKNKNEEQECGGLVFSKDSRSSGCFLIHSCMGWIRGTFQDRVWIRLIIENTSTVTTNQVHLILSPNHLLPKLILRNTQSFVTPGQCIELYAAFTMTDDLFYSQLEHTLTVAIQYTIRRQEEEEEQQQEYHDNDNHTTTSIITNLSNYFN